VDDNKTPIDVRRAAVPGALHGSFTLELELPAPPQDVFAAYGELPLRKKWSRMPGTPDNGGHKLDFRVGGSESLAARFAPMGERTEHMAYRSQFLDIVPDQRIVFTYTFDLDGRRHWASLVTIEILGGADGALLCHTEQYAYLAVTGTGQDDVAISRAVPGCNSTAFSLR
jgi:uncharacterized protein YndB with AHSA1/START domain